MISVLPIETDRLIIRLFRESDADAFFAWRNDAQVARYTLWDYPFAMERAEAFCAKQAAIENLPMGEWFQLFVEERVSGDPVGDIGLGLNADADGALHIGYSISRKHWGKGYATEAVGSAMITIAQAVGLEHLKAEIDARNPSSGRVLEKLGFTPGPLQPKRTLVKGEWCDEIDYYRPLILKS
jgi:ribosomal-protein-alanine N-acetyltransferase